MKSTYDLILIHDLIRRGEYYITNSALVDALNIGFDEDDIIDCILNDLNNTHFYKSMPAKRVPGLWQDVYRINYEGQRVYIKLQVNIAKKAVVVSFKEDTRR